MPTSKILALRLPVELHKELKTLAAASGKTMTEIALSSLRSTLEEHAEEIPAAVRKELHTPRIYSARDMKRFATADKLSPANKAWLEKHFPRPKHEKARRVA